ncbi:MAG: UDP-N-acetylmuramoyl-L-alanine--D-glutamate ligase [Rhodothalassiaceae bacterium]
MIFPRSYRNRRIGIFGLARSGRATVSALAAAGAEIHAWDDDAAHREDLPVPPSDLYALDFSALDVLAVAPGVPLTHPAPHPLVRKAQAAGIPVIGDIELFAAARTDLPPHAVIAVTGTNGKSTAAALLGHVIARAGRPAAVAGNIGVPVLSLDPLPAGGVYVLELSSFQIDLVHTLDPDVAILLNITPDHLDRHGDMAGYVAAKRRLFELQRPPHLAVIGVDDEPGRETAAALPQPVIRISVKRALDDGLFVDDAGTLHEAGADGIRRLGSLAGLPALVGRHNWQNAAASFAAARAVGIAPEAILYAFASFPGLAHRCEPVTRRDGVLFINDSKATNIDAAATALAAFERIGWIAGGRAKSADLAPLAPFLPRIRCAYLIGEAAEDFARALDGKVPCRLCSTIERAVEAAAREAEPGDVVLLSPACASFDQFRDFEARGEAFRNAVLALGKGEAA